MADTTLTGNEKANENLVKVQIDAFQPHTVVGGAKHALSYVKQITTSSDFEAMSEKKRQCQNEETVTECASKLINGGAAEHCKCVPWILTAVEGMEGRKVCQPEGSRCFADFVAMNKDIVKSNCTINCQGLYLDVEEIDDENKLIPIDDDGVGRNEITFNLFKEYRKFRNMEADFYKDSSEEIGFPFKTSQNFRVPLKSWICLGPEASQLPNDCWRLEWDEWPMVYGEMWNPALYEYCILEQMRINLKPENCTDLALEHVNASIQLFEICEERHEFWSFQQTCNKIVPRTMSQEMSEKCRCELKTIQDTFRMQQHLNVIKIYFNAGSFDHVVRSAKTNFVSQLSLIGGTFGLFTGFSLLSFIEIVYFLLKAMASIVTVKRPKHEKKVHQGKNNTNITW